VRREGVKWPARFKDGTRPEPPPAAETEEVVQDSLF
jgi:hypothetical protein